MKVGFIIYMLVIPCCKHMPCFPCETGCYYAKSATHQCLGISSICLPPQKTTNFPFSLRATAAEIFLRLMVFTEKNNKTLLGGWGEEAILNHDAKAEIFYVRVFRGTFHTHSRPSFCSRTKSRK